MIALGLDHRHVKASDLPGAAEGMVEILAEESISTEDRVISLEGATEREEGVSPFLDYLLSTPRA